MAPLHLPLFVLLLLIPLIPLGPILSTASASHSQISPETTPARHHHHHHHHRSPTNPATLHFHPVPSATPSMHQNHIQTEESKSLLAVVPITDESQASSGEETMAAMGAAAGLVMVMPFQAAPPTPPLVAAADLASRALAQQQEEAEGSASATKAAPPLNDPPASTTSLLPLLNQQTSVAAASPSPQIQAGAAGVVGSDSEQILHQLEMILSSLGYNEMASAAPLLANSPPLARWPGAITVFAAPDIFLQASCPMCSRRHLLLEHIAMGYYPYSQLAAAPDVKIPSASVGFCLKSVSERGPFDIHYARIYVDGVEVSHPELYNDGRYVVHGLHGFLRPLSRTSCVDGSHSEVLQMKVASSRPPRRRARSSWNVNAEMAAAAATSIGVLTAACCFTTRKKRSTSEGTPPRCAECRDRDEVWVVTCCGVGFCSKCLEGGILKWHFKNYQKTPYVKWMRRDYVACEKKRRGRLINVGPVDYYGIEEGYIMTEDCPTAVNEGEGTSKIFTRLQDLEDLLHLDHVRHEDWPKKIQADYFKTGGELLWVRSYDLPVSPIPQVLDD